MKYKHHKYTWTNRSGSDQHNWEFVGPNGAVNYHVSEREEYDPVAGLEFHHLTGDGAPDHVDCPLTGGRCWHDGTSLYAIELWSFVATNLRSWNHKVIFQHLENEYDKHFERKQE